VSLLVIALFSPVSIAEARACRPFGRLIKHARAARFHRRYDAKAPHRNLASSWDRRSGAKRLYGDGGRRMAGPTPRLRAEIRRLSRIIAQLRAKPRAEWRLWSPTLRDLESERRMLARVLAARHALAAEKVVDLARWRDPTDKDPRRMDG
jgi:hypothetical protein